MWSKKYIYNVLHIHGNLEGERFFQHIWKLQIPSRVKRFIWKITHNRIQSKENLHKRNILPAGVSVNCVFCESEIEYPLSIYFLDVGSLMRYGHDVKTHFWQHLIGFYTRGECHHSMEGCLGQLRYYGQYGGMGMPYRYHFCKTPSLYDCT